MKQFGISRHRHSHITPIVYKVNNNVYLNNDHHLE